MIKAKDLHKFYGANESRFEVLKGISLSIEDEDYVLEYDENGDEIIRVSKDTVYDMSGLNIGNSYMTYKNDGAKIDEWNNVKESNYDLVVYPYLSFLNNFNNNATEDEKSQLETLRNSVIALSTEVSSIINGMTSEEYLSFLELLKYDIKNIEEEIKNLKT